MLKRTSLLPSGITPSKLIAPAHHASVMLERGSLRQETVLHSSLLLTSIFLHQVEQPEAITR